MNGEQTENDASAEVKTESDSKGENIFNISQTTVHFGITLVGF